MSAIVFSTNAYGYLGDAICALTQGTRGEIEELTFPDGERYMRIRTSVDEREVVLVGGTISDSDTLELYDLACAIQHAGGCRLTLVVPYFGYSTMERAVNPGEVVTAKTRARLLSSIPTSGPPNRVMLVDLHTEGLTHYFEGAVRAVHLYAKPIVTRLVRELAGDDDLVLACTDAGRAKWVESLANDMNVPASFVFKKRLAGDRTQVTAVSAQVEGKTVVIYDDMIRTGGSLIGAAEAYRAAGAKRIAAVCTHGIFPKDALDRIRKSGLFSGLACTDTHPRALGLAGDFLRVESIAPLFAAAL